VNVGAALPVATNVSPLPFAACFAILLPCCIVDERGIRWRLRLSVNDILIVVFVFVTTIMQQTNVQAESGR